MKTVRQLQRYFKGAANHRRISMLFLISKNQGIIVQEVAAKLECHHKTASGHLQKLVQAGLVNKKYRGRAVEHSLSPYGEVMVDVLRKFPNLKS